MRNRMVMAIVLMVTGCEKKGSQDDTGDRFPRGYTIQGEPYGCPDNDYYPLKSDSCASSDEMDAFIKSCSDQRFRVSRCGCVHLCSTRITPVCTEDARIDCLRNEDGSYQSQGVGRSGFACQFPPVPANAVDSKFCAGLNPPESSP